MKRKTYSFLDFLADGGGMQAALIFVGLPILGSIPQRSFKYHLTARHMKVKKRVSAVTVMPKNAINDKKSHAIIHQASINKVDHKRRGCCLIIALPSCFLRNGTHGRLAKLVNRGSEQFEKATDVLTLIRT